MAQLFIDDNPIRGMRMLEVNPSVLISNNTADALELMDREKSFDVIYFEYHLEDTDGVPADKLIEEMLKRILEGELTVGEVITHTLDRLEAFNTIVKFNKVGVPCKWIRFPELIAGMGPQQDSVVE